MGRHLVMIYTVALRGQTHCCLIKHQQKWKMVQKHTKNNWSSIKPNGNGKKNTGEANRKKTNKTQQKCFWRTANSKRLTATMYLQFPLCFVRIFFSMSVMFQSTSVVLLQNFNVLLVFSTVAVHVTSQGHRRHSYILTAAIFAKCSSYNFIQPISSSRFRAFQKYIFT